METRVPLFSSSHVITGRHWHSPSHTCTCWSYGWMHGVITRMWAGGGWVVCVCVRVYECVTKIKHCPWGCVDVCAALPCIDHRSRWRVVKMEGNDSLVYWVTVWTDSGLFTYWLKWNLTDWRFNLSIHIYVKHMKNMLSSIQLKNILTRKTTCLSFV